VTVMPVRLRGGLSLFFDNPLYSFVLQVVRLQRQHENFLPFFRQSVIFFVLQGVEIATTTRELSPFFSTIRYILSFSRVLRLQMQKEMHNWGQTASIGRSSLTVMPVASSSSWGSLFGIRDILRSPGC
jgi:hypothetical protein